MADRNEMSESGIGLDVLPKLEQNIAMEYFPKKPQKVTTHESISVRLYRYIYRPIYFIFEI